MKDSEVTASRNKVFPRERPPLVIEYTSRIISANQTPSKSSGSGECKRKVILSLPRVKWLERPEI